MQRLLSLLRCFPVTFYLEYPGVIPKSEVVFTFPWPVRFLPFTIGCFTSAPNPATGHHQPTPPLETPGHSQEERENQISDWFQLPRGATPRPRSVETTEESSRLRRRRSGREELPHVGGWGRRPRGAAPCPRSGGYGRRRRAERSYSTFKVRSSCEEIPHGQGKRNPSKTVGITRGHQRAETLKP